MRYNVGLCWQGFPHRFKLEKSLTARIITAGRKESKYFMSFAAEDAVVLLFLEKMFFGEAGKHVRMQPEQL